MSDEKHNSDKHAPSLTEVTREYLRGKMTWETYQAFERTLTIRSVDKQGQAPPKKDVDKRDERK